MSKKRNNQKKQQTIQSNQKKTDVKEEQICAERKSKRRETMIFVLVIAALIVLAAIGLWILSGEGNNPSNKLVFTLGEEEVYLDEINLCILQNVVNLGINSASLENITAEDGSSAEEYYKQEILQLIMDYHVEYMIAEKQGITLTEEEEKAVRSDAVQYMGSVNGSIANKLGITQECVNEVYRKRYLARKLEETVTADVTVESQNYCTMYMLLFPKVVMTGDGDYERQEDGETPVMLSDEEISKRKQDADAAYQELIDGAEIEEVAEKYDVAAFSGEESNLAESFGEPFNEYAASLKENEYSPVIETESCYAILKMITVNNQELADQIMSYYKADVEEEKITEMKTQWYEEAGIGDNPDFNGSVWRNISLYDYTQYVEE